MNRFQAIVADIDGTLTEGGNLSTVHPLLKQAIRSARQRGILFSLASGRPFFEQELFHQLLISPDNYKKGEAILYEASHLRLLGTTEVYKLGGLTKEELQEIEDFVRRERLFLEMIPQANNDCYETTTGYVTPTFISEGRTNTELLERTYRKVKPILEQKFSFVNVMMSADAIDIYAMGLTKAKPVQKYSELVGIPLEYIVAIGDSGNDMLMLEAVGNAGGLVIYVGTNPNQERIVRRYACHYISQRKGVLGTVESLNYILKLNSGKK